MVCLLLDFSFLVAFVAFDMVLLGYFCDRLHMGVFSIAFLFWVPFCLLVVFRSIRILFCLGGSGVLSQGAD